MKKHREYYHKNRDKTDNRKFNLRICTRMENLHNQRLAKNNKTGVRGVCFVKNTRGRRKHWIVSIGYEGKKINIGWFLTKLEAIKARVKKEIELYGKFANVGGI